MPDLPIHGGTATTAPQPQRPPHSDRNADASTRWWLVASLLFALQAIWAVATPPMTGPDEADHAVRAAAVARGQVAGEPAPSLLGADNVFVVTRVPESYGRASTASVCFLGRSATGSVGTLGAENPPCTSIGDGDDEVTARTLQYRGQPFAYALLGWTSLVTTSETGMTLMRLATAAIVALLCASAYASACQLPARRLGGLAVALTWSPVLVYLAGSVNTTPIETAGAIGLWASGAALARGPQVDRRLVLRAAIAGVVLVGARGLGPVFAVLILGMLLPLAGRTRLRELTRRSDVRVASVIVALAAVLSSAWLLWVQQRFPLDERTGTGISHAIGRLPYFLQQTVGVFSVNDIELPAWAVVAWVIPVLGVVVAGWRLGFGAARALPLAALVLSAALSVSAEGASIPPIGYDWQGRYVLPLLVGVPILAAAVAEWDPLIDDGPLAALAIGPVALHVWAFVAVGRHFASQGPDLLSIGDALTDPIWRTPGLALGAWTLVVLLVVLALTRVVLGTPERLERSAWRSGSPTTTIPGRTVSTGR